MALLIPTTTLKHTAANGYRCADPRCPCQSAGITDPIIERFHTYALKSGSSDCAWCRDEQGLSQGNGLPGICKRHAGELRARAKQSKGKEHA